MREKLVRLFEREGGALEVVGESANWPKSVVRREPDPCGACGQARKDLEPTYSVQDVPGRRYEIRAEWPRPRESAEKLLRLSRMEPDPENDPERAGQILRARTRVKEIPSG